MEVHETTMLTLGGLAVLREERWALIRPHEHSLTVRALKTCKINYFTFLCEFYEKFQSHDGYRRINFYRSILYLTLWRKISIFTLKMSATSTTFEKINLDFFTPLPSTPCHIQISQAELTIS